MKKYVYTVFATVVISALSLVIPSAKVDSEGTENAPFIESAVETTKEECATKEIIAEIKEEADAEEEVVVVVSHKTTLSSKTTKTTEEATTPVVVASEPNPYFHTSEEWSYAFHGGDRSKYYESISNLEPPYYTEEAEFAFENIDFHTDYEVVHPDGPGGENPNPYEDDIVSENSL